MSKRLSEEDDLQKLKQQLDEQKKRDKIAKVKEKKDAKKRKLKVVNELNKRINDKPPLFTARKETSKNLKYSRLVRM